MRCPQCGTKVPASLDTVKVVGEGALILQVRCNSCHAYIVLHAQVAGVESVSAPGYEGADLHNASSVLEVTPDELAQLRGALDDADGSFQKLFQK